jgi:hypothetical protein
MRQRLEYDPVVSRHVLIRTEDDPERVVAETALPTEAELHDALTRHPQLIPMSDVGLGDAVVVGRESGLAAGYADLVLIDERGRLCLVEVKNEGNPDTRRVIAQLLDYAASLWGLGLDEFEQRVVHPFLLQEGVSPLPSVAEYVVSAIEGDGDVDELADQLAQTLAAGEFALVVAAPRIPVGVQRVLEYLNARGQRMFGLEVSYFRGQVECFVPRLVVKPLTADPGGESRGATALDEETFVAQLPERARKAVTDLLRAVSDIGADVLWKSYGPSITVTRGQQRQVAYLEAKRLGVTLKATGGFPQEPFDATRARFSEIGTGGPTRDGWYWNISLTESSDADLVAALEAARGLVEELVLPIAFGPLDEPLDATFTRNDHNLWLRHIPILEPLQGRHLRGRLGNSASGETADIELVPLANDQPGWRPRFIPASARETLWPAAATGDEFRLRIDAASPVPT